MRIRPHKAVLAALCGLVLGVAQVQAQGVPIGALPAATLPLSGSELTILSQNGQTVKATVNAVLAPGLTIASNRILGNVSGVSALATGLTATQVQTLLGLGTAAYQNIGSSGANVPLLNAINTWSALQTFSGGVAISGTLTVSALNVTGTSQLGTGTASPLIVTSTGTAANVASGAGSIELKPANLQVNVTGALATTTTMTAGTGLTVTTGGALISGGVTVSDNGIAVTGGLQVLTLGAQINGNTAITAGTFTASGGAVALSPIGANVVLSPSGAGVVTISPATAGTLNNMVIGGVTPLAATFTTATANSFVPNLSTVPTNGLYLPSANTLGFAANSALQVQIIGTASASRSITLAGSNGGNPTINVTAGSLAVTPATVFASTISATSITNTTGVVFSGATAPLTLNGSVGTSGQVLMSAGAGATPTWGAPSTLTWAGIKTTNFNAAVNTAYCVDTLTTGAVTMTLPAAPADGDQIRFIDCKSNFANANLSVARNGKSVMGLAADMTVNTPNAAATLTYVSANSDWRMY